MNIHSTSITFCLQICPIVDVHVQLSQKKSLPSFPRALQLREDETAAIVARRCALDTRVAGSIHSRSGGWVAGVRLLLAGDGGVASGAGALHSC